MSNKNAQFYIGDNEQCIVYTYASNSIGALAFGLYDGFCGGGIGCNDETGTIPEGAFNFWVAFADLSEPRTMLQQISTAAKPPNTIPTIAPILRPSFDFALH